MTSLNIFPSQNKAARRQISSTFILQHFGAAATMLQLYSASSAQYPPSCFAQPPRTRSPKGRIFEFPADHEALHDSGRLGRHHHYRRRPSGSPSFGQRQTGETLLPYSVQWMATQSKPSSRTSVPVKTGPKRTPLFPRPNHQRRIIKCMSPIRSSIAKKKNADKKLQREKHHYHHYY